MTTTKETKNIKGGARTTDGKEDEKKDSGKDALSRAIKELKNNIPRHINNAGGKKQYPYINLPTPGMMEGYESLFPGFSEKFLEILANERKHENNIETQRINAIIKQRKFGQIIFAVVSTINIYSCTLLSSIGHSKMAALLGISSFGALTVSAYFSTKFLHRSFSNAHSFEKNDKKPK